MSNLNKLFPSLILAVGILLPVVTNAGGFLVRSSGVPLKWNNAAAIQYTPDGGSLGALDNAAALVSTAASFARWANLSGTNLSFTVNSTTPLSSDGDVDTAAEFMAIRGVNDGISPVVFDTDGTLFQALGFGSNVLGFAGPEFSSGTTIIEGFQAYNGAFVQDTNSATVAALEGTMAHEIGHLLNLDHTQINGHFFLGDNNDPSFAQYGVPLLSSVALMFPIQISNRNTPATDDVAWMSKLYPSGGGVANDGGEQATTITGTVFASDGTTGFQGANVIGRQTTDPFFSAVSNVSGYLSSSGTNDGTYELPGISTGTYTVEIVHINSQFTGGSSVGPIDPPITFPSEEFYNGANESASNVVLDDPSQFTAVTAGATGINIILNVNNPVPVELVSFSFEVLENSVTLVWQTASETNNFGFDIERGGDGNDFSKIGFAEGKGTTTIPQNYDFTDTDLAPSIYYYRLKQIDFDGAFEYSDVLQIEILAPENFTLAQNYPNPFNPTTVIHYELPVLSIVTLTVFDVMGREIVKLLD